MTIQFSMDIKIQDEARFRRAARERAKADGLSDADADNFLDAETRSLGACAIMLFDPGQGPDGCDIVGSSAE